MPEGMIHTIPVRLEACEVPDQFSFLQWCDYFEPDGFDRLVHAIRFGFKQRSVTVPEPSKVPLLPETRLIESINMELILIPAGEFMMGTPREQMDGIAGGVERYRNLIENEAPPHRVEISQAFYMGKYPVTQAQWEMVMGSSPSRFKGDNLPVDRVSWEDVREFMQKLNEREGNGLYRLPSEAEWEYACRAGSTGLYAFGDDTRQLGKYAWYDGNAGGTTHPVGQKEANEWGLYDMHGNVWEWVQDWYAEDYYGHSPSRDPQGPDAGPARVIRGGSWLYSARDVRAASRYWHPPGSRDVLLGFRCSSSG